MRRLLLMAAAVVTLAGCSPRVRHVPVESVRTEWLDRDVERVVADTVRDTRMVWIKGDTMVDIRREERLRRVEIHDTCIVERTDTIRETREVERQLTRWQQAKMDFGGAAIGATVLAVCYLLFRIIRKIKS